MSLKSKVDPTPNQILSLRLASHSLRRPLEQLVSAHTGRPWTAKHARDMAELAAHPAAILSDGSYAVFAKFNDATHGLEQFERELAGLRLLSERAGVHTPTPIGIIRVAGGSLLVLEAVPAVEREPHHWRHIGQTLARIHSVKWAHFGLDTHNYFGPFYQDNTPRSDWPTFYAERRLWPALRAAIDSGHLPPVVIEQVDKLIARLPELCGPAMAPALLHGDAQQNNFISQAGFKELHGANTGLEPTPSRLRSCLAAASGRGSGPTLGGSH